MSCQHDPASGGACPQCGFDAFVRNHYFTGKMMGAAEFGTESLYHADKMRHHNVRLHGTGTVCGLRVHQHPTSDCWPRYVVVEPGSALDCCGREILVTDEEYIDVAGAPALQQAAADQLLHDVQVCLCYRECPTEEVPVLYDECGCDDTACAPNRILESFTFELRVDPPLPALAATGIAAQGVLSASDQHGVTGFLRADAAGRVVLVDPADAHRLLIVDSVHRSRRTIASAQAIRALALSADALTVFAATESGDASAESEIHAWTVADGTEVPPVGAGVRRKLAGTSAASIVRLATSTDPSRALVAYLRDSGELLAFAADVAHAIADAPATPIGSAAALDALSVAPDGSVGWAIDGVNRLVMTIDFSGAAPVALPGLPAGAWPVALAAFEWQGTLRLAVADAAGPRVDIVDPATGAVLVVDLQHPPAALGAVGDGSAADVRLQVLEQAGSGWFLQAIALAPAAIAGGTPLVTAARAVGTGPRQIVLVGTGGAATLDVATLAEGACGDHVTHQLDGCPGCDDGDCVVLATLVDWRGGATLRDLPAEATDLVQRVARIDNLLGRHILASTASLQAWLECLQLQGGIAGPAGPAGPAGAPGTQGQQGEQGEQGEQGQQGAQGEQGEQGEQGPAGGGIDRVEITLGDCGTVPSGTVAEGVLNLTLPHCCDDDFAHLCGINWTHAGRMPPLPSGGIPPVVLAFDAPLLAADCTPQNLQHAFIVEASHLESFDDMRALCWCQLAGEYTPLQLGTRCDLDSEHVAADTEINALQFAPASGLRNGGRYRVRFIGDLVRDAKNERAVDANHLPPWLPKRRTGDCIEGGVFHSWFVVERG